MNHLNDDDRRWMKDDTDNFLKHMGALATFAKVEDPEDVHTCKLLGILFELEKIGDGLLTLISGNLGSMIEAMTVASSPVDVDGGRKTAVQLDEQLLRADAFSQTSVILPQEDPRSKNACTTLKSRLSTLESLATSAQTCCNCSGNVLMLIQAYLSNNEDRMKIIVSKVDELNKAKTDFPPGSRLGDLIDTFIARIDVKQVAQPKLDDALSRLRTSAGSLL